MKSALKFFLALASLMISTNSVWAFKLSPMIANFSPLGTAATQNFQIENTGGEKLSVQIEAFHRFTDLDGKETRTPTDEFSIYPQQLTLLPREKRTVRITWNGTRQPDRELNYRLVVSELQASASTAEIRAGTSFLMQYVASLYVTPDHSQPKVDVESFKVLADGRGELVLHNSGLAHGALKGIKVVLKAGTEIDAEKFEELQNENILSKSSRRFYLPLPQSVRKAEKSQPGSVKAEVTL
jgi:fimbrial chaperone protein